MLAAITLLGALAWAFSFAITIAFYMGMAYLGGVLFGPDVPEAEAGPTADAQSRSWNPHSTQQEGRARPRAYGRNMHHGNIVAKWTDVVDDREVLYMIVEHGDGPTKGTVYTDGTPEVYLNDQPAANFGSVDIQERIGTLNQTCMDGFEKTKLDYEQNAELVLNEEPIVVTTPNDFFDDIEFTVMGPNGLLRYHKDGDQDVSWVHFKVRISVHGVDSWTTILDKTIVDFKLTAWFKLYKVSELGFSVVRGVQYDLEFTNMLGTHPRHVNDLYFRSFREVVDVAFTRPGKALVGIRAVATEQLSGRLDVKIIREDKLIDVWNGTAWEIKYSRNRAWVAYDALTQPVISGDGGANPWTIEHYEGMNPAQMDLMFFYNWAEFCSAQVPSGYPAPDNLEDRLACDTILDFHTDVWSFVNELANIGRAYLYWQGHTLTGWIDDVVAEITALVTMDNIMSRSWKNAWSEKNELAGKVEVLFQDSRQGYERMPAALPNESAGKYTNIISIEGVGITTRGTAIHVANHALKRNELIRNVNQFRQYKDAFRYHLGNVIRLQHQTPDWGKSYRVVRSTANNKITLDRHPVASTGELFYVQVYDEVKGKVRVDSYTVSTVVGKIVTIAETWDTKPRKNTTCAIGVAGKVQVRRIIKMEPRQDNYWDIAVETYDEALFTADDIVPDLPDRNYIWGRPANPLTRPISRVEVIDIIHGVMVPQTDVDAPVTSNCTWTGSGGDTVSWSKTDANEPISFRYKGVSYEITPDSTTDEFIYWDPNFTTTFRTTNDAAVAVELGKWYMCRNVAGVAYPTVPFSSVHGGVIQVGTITATLGQIADLAVSTLKIQDNAVTLPESAFTAGSISFGGETTIQSLAFTTTGQPLYVQFSGGFTSGGSVDPHQLTLRIYRDTTKVYEITIPVPGYGAAFALANIYGFNFSESPGVGSYTYYIKAVTGIVNASAKNRSLYIHELKK